MKLYTCVFYKIYGRPDMKYPIGFAMGKTGRHLKAQLYLEYLPVVISRSLVSYPHAIHI